MENNSVKKLILGFFVIILGVVLINSIATESIAVTELTGASGEAIDLALDRDLVTACGMGLNGTYEYVLTNAPTDWKSDDCPLENFVLLNQTGVAATVTTDYVLFPANGSLFLKNTTTFVLPNCSATGTAGLINNDTTVFYDYCGDDYLNLNWGRTILNLVAGFFALALLGAGVGLFYSVAKDAGIVSK